VKPTIPAWRRAEIRARATAPSGFPAGLVPGHLVGEVLTAYEGELQARGALDEERIDGAPARDPAGWILTHSGVRFWPLDPRAEEVRIEDIAHALARLCRFAGHVACAHYSVAQHSVLVSHACHPDDALWGLLHDATEAYLVDVPSPVKRAPALASYRAAERQLERVIAERFGLPLAMPPSVRLADARLLATEKRDLRAHADGLPGAKPLTRRIEAWCAERARDEFMRRFEVLQARRAAEAPAEDMRARAAGDDE